MKFNKKITQSLDLFHILLPIALLGFILNFFFNTQNIIMLEITAFVVLIYIIFSLVHHHQDKSLTLETFIQYILIGCLILILMAGAIQK